VYPQQTNHLSNLQLEKQADSIQFEEFKKNHPDYNLNRRMAIRLQNGCYIVKGFASDIVINNNHITDSVDHNFHLGTTDVSTAVPYSQVKVSDSDLNLILFFHLLPRPLKSILEIQPAIVGQLNLTGIKPMLQKRGH
jgi:hypothetical protein